MLTTSPNPLLRPLAFAALLLALTLAAYWPATRAGFIWDDDDYVYANPTLRAPDALQRIWFVPAASPQYYPIVFTTFYLEHALWGLDPAGYHLTNILLHAASAILLWRILKRLAIPGAPLAAALFALHPVMVESVAWVTERKNTLSLFFMLAALLMYLRFALAPASPAADQPAPPRWRCYAAALLLFTLALLSKTVTCALPVLLLLILWWKRPRLTRRDFALIVPFLLLGLAAGLNTALLEVTHVGAHGQAWNFSFLDRILIAGHALCFYTGQLLLPLDLCFYYPRWTIDSAVPWQYLYPIAALAALSALFLLRSRLGKAPFIAALAFAALLFPALGFFNLYPMLFSFVADHFQYHAAPALLALFAAALTLAARRFLGPRTYLAPLLALPLLAALGAQTYLTCQNYHDAKTLWLSIINRHPHWNAYVGLSSELTKEAQSPAASPQAAQSLLTQAIDAANHALALRPECDTAYCNLGNDYRLLRDYPRSIASFQKALTLKPNDDRFHAGLAETYAQSGQPKLAITEYQSALQLNPTKPFYFVSLAGLFLDLGLEDRTRAALAAALALDPANAPAHTLQGFLLASTDHIPEAIAEFDRALHTDPNHLEALNSYARALAIHPQATPQELQLALDRATRAVELTRRANPNYLDTLAMIHHARGHNPQALALLEEALNLLPPTATTARAPLLRHLTAYQPPPNTTAPAPH